MHPHFACPTLRRLDATQGLEAHDFTDLWHEKLLAHLSGTREWAFVDILAWLDQSDAAQLSWLMGGGGVGKSVLTAELLHRTFDRVVAWHFCRHDNPQQSSSAALLRSLAAMLCARLPGYKEALGTVSADLLTMTDPKELFEALFTAPLQKIKSPDTPRLIILDALDELPKKGQKALLDVIAQASHSGHAEQRAPAPAASRTASKAPRGAGPAVITPPAGSGRLALAGKSCHSLHCVKPRSSRSSCRRSPNGCASLSRRARSRRSGPLSQPSSPRSCVLTRRRTVPTSRYVHCTAASDNSEWVVGSMAAHNVLVQHIT